MASVSSVARVASVARVTSVASVASVAGVASDNNSNDNNDDDLLTDPLDGSSLLNYINYNYKVNQIKLFTNYAVEAGLTESNYSKTD